jgi:hypothetical protein
MEQQQEVDVEIANEAAVDIDKYVIPDKVFFLKDKRHVPITELKGLTIALDKNKKGPKITLRGVAVSQKDGKDYKTSTYLGLKDRPKKKRSPRKKRAKKTDAAIQADAAAAVVAAAPEVALPSA